MSRSHRSVAALVLDLDGTVLRSDKTISGRNARAVQRCMELGIAVIVATARPPRSVRTLISDLPAVDCIVYYNGALVQHRSRREGVHTPIPREVNRRVTALIRSQIPESHIVYEVRDVCYTCTAIPETELAVFGLGPGDTPPAVVDASFAAALSPTKILVPGYDAWPRLQEELGHAVNVMATDGGTLIQIMHATVSKESAVERVLADRGISPEDTMVFGDDVNDLGLFGLCGFPVAMGNAIPELLSCAAYVTESNDQDGVARAIEKFVFASAPPEEVLGG